MEVKEHSCAMGLGLMFVEDKGVDVKYKCRTAHACLLLPVTIALVKKSRWYRMLNVHQYML